MQANEVPSLWALMSSGAERQFLDSATHRAGLLGLHSGSALDGCLEDLRGRSVLLVTKDQLSAALALLELDGIARRIVLCPPDFSSGSIPAVVRDGEIEVIVTDYEPEFIPELAGVSIVRCGETLNGRRVERTPSQPTEWVLFTSGTTGQPKMAVHDLAGLIGAIRRGGQDDPAQVWATFYDMRRYGGLQIYLRAMTGHLPLILSSADEPLTAHLERLGRGGVTHISGTPSHWRRVLMSPAAHKMAPRYIRLSGEIADQGVLDGLRALYPEAKVVHAYASTEAGVGFEVHDELEGFPASFVEMQWTGVELRVKDWSLQIRSTRSASRYLPEAVSRIRQEDGFVDTGDLVELRGNRYYFAGRKDGVINVGGQKVHPEEVEAVINRHPRVRMSLVTARKSPLLGSLVMADIVPDADVPSAVFDDLSRAALENEIRAICSHHLARHKVPALIRFVDSLAMTNGGKLARQNA